MFGQLIQAMVKVVDARDLITINNKLSGQWDLSELSYNNVEMNSYKRQKNLRLSTRSEHREEQTARQRLQVDHQLPMNDKSKPKIKQWLFLEYEIW